MSFFQNTCKLREAGFARVRADGNKRGWLCVLAQRPFDPPPDGD